MSEMFILLVVAVLGLAALTLSARVRLLRDFQATPGDGRDSRWVDRPGWAVLGLILIVALAIWILLIIIDEGASPILLALSVGFALFLVLWFLMSPVMISAGLFWTWSRLAAVSRDPSGVRRARNLVFLSTVGAVALIGPARTSACWLTRC